MQSGELKTSAFLLDAGFFFFLYFQDLTENHSSLTNLFGEEVERSLFT